MAAESQTLFHRGCSSSSSSSSSSSLLIILSLILICIYLSQTCHAADNSNCTPSSCGVIRNISFPFRLKDEPKNCGDHRYELACENNVTSVYLNSHKYYVKKINYRNSTIMMVDPSINHDDVCSFPALSTYSYNFSDRSSSYNSYSSSYPINFISCPTPLKNSSLFVDVNHDCATSNLSHPTRYTYIKVDHMRVSDLKEACRLEKIVLTSWEFKDLKNVSLSEIHHSLLYGFELEFCPECRLTSFMSTWEQIVVFGQPNLMSVLLVVAVLCSAVISSPVMIIFALAVVVGISLKIAYSSFWSAHVHLGNVMNPSVVMICAPRFIILPLVVWLLIRKFRTRHSSMYEGIESFLQSDNKLAPIRYPYSDIKKVTRGFREKLGEGGFGSVYKGTLRSGHHVAVKLLGKSGGNGQDFINEIATIGRIHHVNVVQLVGYCAERSKRALVFDFMPHGSLEKYLFNREKMGYLNWDTKFEIAVGVARGIEYLHRGCDIQILHFDIKPHNILLDDKFIPKITDFGLAKFYSTEKKTVTMTAARGTIGYVAPELISRSIGAVSYKVDVYSFGMLLMEMVGLNRELKGNNDDSSKYFPYWIYDRFNEGMDIGIEMREESNGNDENESSRKSVVKKMTIVGLWCIQMNPDDRPSMSKVLQMMEGDVARLQIPNYPSQSAHVAVNVDEESSGTSGSDSVSLLHSKNGSSIAIDITSA